MDRKCVSSPPPPPFSTNLWGCLRNRTSYDILGPSFFPQDTPTSCDKVALPSPKKGSFTYCVILRAPFFHGADSASGPLSPPFPPSPRFGDYVSQTYELYFSLLFPLWRKIFERTRFFLFLLCLTPLSEVYIRQQTSPRSSRRVVSLPPCCSFFPFSFLRSSYLSSYSYQRKEQVSFQIV